MVWFEASKWYGSCDKVSFWNDEYMNFINLNCRMKYATYAVANESLKFLPEYRGRGSIPDNPEVLSRFFWQLIFWSSSLHFLRFLSPTDIKKLFAFFPFSLLKENKFHSHDVHSQIKTYRSYRRQLRSCSVLNPVKLHPWFHCFAGKRK